MYRSSQQRYCRTWMHVGVCACWGEGRGASSTRNAGALWFFCFCSAVLIPNFPTTNCQQWARASKEKEKGRSHGLSLSLTAHGRQQGALGAQESGIRKEGALSALGSRSRALRVHFPK
jgi:hypothetical protein